MHTLCGIVTYIIVKSICKTNPPPASLPARSSTCPLLKYHSLDGAWGMRQSFWLVKCAFPAYESLLCLCIRMCVCASMCVWVCVCVGCPVCLQRNQYGVAGVIAQDLRARLTGDEEEDSLSLLPVLLLLLLLPGPARSCACSCRGYVAKSSQLPLNFFIDILCMQSLPCSTLWGSAGVRLQDLALLVCSFMKAAVMICFMKSFVLTPTTPPLPPSIFCSLFVERKVHSASMFAQ